MGMFHRKCSESGIRVKQTEPYTPWSNAAEAAIRELKKGVGQQMVQSKAPKKLWDNCLEREAYVHSLTAHEIFRLDGQVPETIVRGETTDISPFATFKRYKWVLYRDASVTYPDDGMVLFGRDLGPALDIGPAMTRKVRKANGQVVYRSTVRSPSPDEMADKTRTKERETFTALIEKLFGDSFNYEDFSNDPKLESLGTPSFEPHEDDKGGQPPAIQDNNDEADLDTYNQYVGTEVVLPIGGTMMNAYVPGRKRQSDGTLLGKPHSNPRS